MNLYIDISNQRLLSRFSREKRIDSIYEESCRLHPWLKHHQLSGIYFGNLCCPRLAPSLKRIANVMETARALGLRSVFVMPFIAQSDLKMAEEILQFLDALAERHEKIEVETNDWGVFRQVGRRFLGLRPLLGRQLQCMDSDPRVDMNRHPSFSGTVREAFMRSSLTTPSRQRTLSEHRVKRVELQLIATGWRMNVPELGFRASLHFPYYLQSTARLCPIKEVKYPNWAEKMDIESPCNKQCQSYHSIHRMHKGESDFVDFFLAGRGLFYDTEVNEQNLRDLYIIPTGADRLVYAPAIPI